MDLKTALAPVEAKLATQIPVRVGLTKSGLVLVISAFHASGFGGGICPLPRLNEGNLLFQFGEPGNAWSPRSSNSNEMTVRFSLKKIWGAAHPAFFGSTKTFLRRETTGFLLTLPENRKLVRARGETPAKTSRISLEEISAAKNLINQALAEHAIILSLDENGRLCVRMEREL